ncbi:stage III sporulation protein AE [Clostridium sp. MT-14]|uniref:Stage III sporulation protein AE n=1 Tax=Clostridium aromativorans TaxID=2836848 RepID=A0ABS8N2L6_9CLOT|nr:stage III sporulation protein AE [Clostridium aromativorans]MCC9294051.1 stage III sporulation protein AE [Clostridium aromativorans]CAB1242954.1 Stage III sporulation protein AE [Clostridiaceae bacterium BL-3]
MKNVIVSLLVGLFLSLIMGFNVQAFDTNTVNTNIQDNAQLENTSQNGTGNKESEAQEQQIENFYNYISNMKTKNEVLKDLDAKDYVKNFIKSGDGKISLKKIMNILISYGLREMSACIKLLVLLIVIALICALLTNLQRAFSGEGLSNIAYFACYSLIIIIMAKSFYIGVDIARSTIKEMTDFMVALIPILITLIAAVGGFVEASIMDPIIIGAINISANLFMDIIIPIISMSFVLQFVNNLSSEYKIDKLTKLLNQCALWAQGIIMTVFIGIVTVRGITSKSIDEVTVKTAKFAVDNFVPVVGKSLSDAVATVAGYSFLLKNALSSLGLLIIIIILLFPIIKLIIMIVLYKITAALIEPISDGRLVNCINSAGDSLILVMACLICVSVMFFIMIAMLASAGKVMM